MLEITTQIEVPEELLGDIMVTAFDGTYGGCNYWANATITKAEDGVWQEVKVAYQDGEDDPIEHKDVTYKVLVLGMQRMLDQGEYKQELNQALLDGDGGMIDADGADWIVQMGLFGKLVYG